LWASWLQRPPPESVFGHTELPDASKDAGKSCPGENLDMDRIRWEIDGMPKGHYTRTAAAAMLREIGVRF